MLQVGEGHLGLFFWDPRVARRLRGDRGIGEGLGGRQFVTCTSTLESVDLFLIMLLDFALLLLELEEGLLYAAEFRELRLELSFKLFALVFVHGNLLAQTVIL